ncbi:MAG TPA: hypothetical protein V6D14_12535 [Coleofasciculaceae cyanobacterium]
MTIPSDLLARFPEFYQSLHNHLTFLTDSACWSNLYSLAVVERSLFFAIQSSG